VSPRTLAIVRRIQAFVGLPAERSSTALVSAGLFFLVVGSQYVIKPVRNSVFVQRVGADSLPMSTSARQSWSGSSSPRIRATSSIDCHSVG